MMTSLWQTIHRRTHGAWLPYPFGAYAINEWSLWNRQYRQKRRRAVVNYPQTDTIFRYHILDYQRNWALKRPLHMTFMMLENFPLEIVVSGSCYSRHSPGALNPWFSLFFVCYCYLFVLRSEHDLRPSKIPTKNQCRSRTDAAAPYSSGRRLQHQQQQEIATPLYDAALY